MGSTSGRSWSWRARDTLLQAQRRSPPSLVRFALAVVHQMNRLEPFDRAMTLAAQAFTSIFPVVIVTFSLLPQDDSGRLGGRVAQALALPESTRSALADALPRRCGTGHHVRPVPHPGNASARADRVLSGRARAWATRPPSRPESSWGSNEKVTMTTGKMLVKACAASVIARSKGSSRFIWFTTARAKRTREGGERRWACSSVSRALQLQDRPLVEPMLPHRPSPGPLPGSPRSRRSGRRASSCAGEVHQQGRAYGRAVATSSSIRAWPQPSTGTPPGLGRGLVLLLGAAATVVTAAGIRLGAEIVAPVMLGLVLTIAVLPLTRWAKGARLARLGRTSWPWLLPA